MFADSDEDGPLSTEGHGFCDACLARCADCPHGPPPNLAVLSCEGCDAESKQQGGLCMPCDLRVHQSLDADAHTRIFFSARHAADALETDDEDSGAGTKTSGARSLQHSRFKLALNFDVEVAHRDAMASYAGRIWPGSALLCRYIELEHERALAEGRPPPFLGKKIVELGAGCQSHTSTARTPCTRTSLLL
jgi:hypothetical protein